MMEKMSGKTTKKGSLLLKSIAITAVVACLVGLLFLYNAPAFPSDSDPVLLVHGWGLNTWIT